MPTRILGVSNLIYSPEEMTVPRLSSDGMTVEGWVSKPDGPWQPEDLLWVPPTATKSTDIDRAGSIVDVIEGPGDYDWVTAQLNKRERYLDAIRAKVRAGAYRLTAQLAKFLGMDFDEDGAELVPRTGTVAYGKSSLATAKAIDPDALALAKTLRDTAYALGAGPRVDPDTGLPVLPGRA
jgi:hypothetical protein